MERTPGFSRHTLRGFLDRLASASAAPGGGSAAAITAALGSALLEMTAGINQKRSFSRDASRRLKKIQKIRRVLLALAARDAAAFQKLSRLGKKDRTGFVYQNALRQSAKVPFKICELCHEALRLAQTETGRTSRWLASDLAEAVLLLESAQHAARWNVEINLGGLRDKKYAGKLRSHVAGLEATARQNKNKVFRGLGYR